VVLPVHDAAIVGGVTVTDFCRTFRHRLFRWPDHLARFRRDCATCFIDLPYTDDQLTTAAHQLVEHNAQSVSETGELALITFATPGPIGAYAGEPGNDGPPTLGMHTFPLAFARYRRFFSEGVILAIAGHHAAEPADLAPPAVKHRSRLHWWRGEHLLRQRTDVPAGAVPLLLDAPNGAITETAIGHLLLVRGGTVLAPPAGTVLDGISLRVVRELCAAEGIPFDEQRFTLADVAVATEAMLTGSAFCLAGVRQVEGTTLPWPGSITQCLLAAWSAMVGSDIAGQFLT
jgi:branched-subunit amino acid aminotransferase/4-amino-4-deoxychorismate lyase